MNEELHKMNWSPMNHEVDYHNGWFYVDNEPAQRRPKLTLKANKLYSKGIRATYSNRGNTFFIYD